MELLPLFLKLAGRRVVLVGAGTVAGGKLDALVRAGADVRVVDPDAFQPADLDDAWLVVSACSVEINRAVAAAAEARRIFVNAVDDPPNATAYLGGVVRRSGVTIAISTSGNAPALAGVLREGIDALHEQHLAPVDVSETRERRLVEQRLGNGHPGTRRRLEATDCRVDVGFRREEVGTERAQCRVNGDGP